MAEKSHKRQNNTGRRATNDSQLWLLQWAFLAKEKNSDDNKNFTIKFPKHSWQRRKTRREENNVSVLPAGIA